VCVCVCVCVCVYVCVCLRIYTYIYTYLYIYKYMYIYALYWKRRYTFIYMFMYMYIYAECVPVRCTCIYIPLTEEITLTICGSPDLSVFLLELLRDGDSVYSHENLFQIWRILMNGDSRESLLEISAVVIILSPISFVRGICIYEECVPP